MRYHDDVFAVLLLMIMPMRATDLDEANHYHGGYDPEYEHNRDHDDGGDNDVNDDAIDDERRPWLWSRCRCV